jgi:hypothetical protein
MIYSTDRIVIHIEHVLPCVQHVDDAILVLVIHCYPILFAEKLFIPDVALGETNGGIVTDHRLHRAIL